MLLAYTNTELKLSYRFYEKNKIKCTYFFLKFSKTSIITYMYVYIL